MTNWYYYDRSGNKIGPINSTALKALVQQGLIITDTIIENEQGKSAKAGNVKGLEFPKPPDPVVVPPPIYSVVPTEIPNQSEEIDDLASSVLSQADGQSDNPFAVIDAVVQQHFSAVPTNSASTSSVGNDYESRSPSGRLRVISEPTVYIPKNLASEWLAFFLITYDGQTDKGGYFNVDGNTCEITISSDDKKSVGIEVIRQDITITRCYFRRPGIFNVTFSVGSESVVRKIEVVELPIKGEHMNVANLIDAIPSTSQEVIQQLGFPDEELSIQVKFPKEITKDHIHYGPKITEKPIIAKHWRYKKYPGLVISTVNGKVYAVSTCTLGLEQLPARWVKHEDKSEGPGAGCLLTLLLLGGCICFTIILASLLFVPNIWTKFLK